MEHHLPPFFSRVGSKSAMYRRILPFIPRTTTYIEPFCGGMSIFLKKVKSKINILNDIDASLIADYKLLLENDYDKKYMLERIHNWVANTEKNDRLPAEAHEFALMRGDYDANNKNDILLRALLLRNYTFGGIPCSKIRLYGKRGCFSLRKINNLDKYKKKMGDVDFFSIDYQSLLKKHQDNTDCFVYLDPPYDNSNEFYSNASIDYDVLADLLKKSKFKFMLSIHDNPNVISLFKWCEIQRITFKSQAKRGLTKKDRTELLITNYEYKKYESSIGVPKRYMERITTITMKKIL